jgi:predicted RNA-binding Zn ribbon-like protein
MTAARWSWLGAPLAIDFANSVRRRAMHYEELFSSGADVVEWARLQHGRVPVPTDAGERLHEIREVRDAVFSLLLAATREEHPPAEAQARVNAALAAVPLIPQLRAGEVVLTAPGKPDALSELHARAAASALEVILDPALAFCDAPGCGQFFVRHRNGQVWCDPHCGTRARVARHAAANR